MPEELAWHQHLDWQHWAANTPGALGPSARARVQMGAAIRASTRGGAPRAAALTCWILDQLSCTDSPFTAPVTARKQPRKHGAKPPCERGAMANAQELVVHGARLAMGSLSEKPHPSPPFQ